MYLNRGQNDQSVQWMYCFPHSFYNLSEDGLRGWRDLNQGNIIEKNNKAFVYQFIHATIQSANSVAAAQCIKIMQIQVKSISEY